MDACKLVDEWVLATLLPRSPWMSNGGWNLGFLIATIGSDETRWCSHSRPAQNLLAIGAKLHPWCTEAAGGKGRPVGQRGSISFGFMYHDWIWTLPIIPYYLPTPFTKRVSRLQWSWHRMHACVSMSLSISIYIYIYKYLFLGELLNRQHNWLKWPQRCVTQSHGLSTCKLECKEREA